MMALLDPRIVRSIYRQAIDPSASDGEGDVWWSEVGAELSSVRAYC